MGWLRSLDARLNEWTWYRIARNSLRGLNRNDGPRLAAAMTYFAVFSIFPFILVLISLLAFVIDAEDAEAQVISQLSSFLPGSSSGVQQLISGVISARGVAFGFGIVVLLWSATTWFENIDRSVNEMWGVNRRRSFVKGKLFALAMVFGLAFVMLLTWAMNFAVGVVRGYAGALGLGSIPGSDAVWALAAGGLSFLLISLVCLLLYRYSPMCDLSFGQVWRGALITGFIWEVVRSGFAIYVAHFANFQSLYGPLAVVIVLMFWLYIAHMIVLLGAELTYFSTLEAHGIRQPDGAPCGAVEERRRRGEGDDRAA
jgi:membrane protein